MSCGISCLRNHVVISQSVTFTDGTLLIDLPAGNYENGEKYCIVVAQEIPTTTTIAANVAITIGGVTTTTYPLINCNCTNVQACQISTRKKYPATVVTNISSGVFRLINNINCGSCNNCNKCNNSAAGLPITAPAAVTENA